MHARRPSTLDPARIATRFWSKVDKNGPIPTYRPDLGPCWLWLGSNSRGYGHFYLPLPDGRNIFVRAARWAYTELVTAVPDHLDIDHLCRNPPCVNPTHLDAVTPAVNVRRGRRVTERSSHCIRGHPYEGENLLLAPGRWGPPTSVCRTCLRASSRAMVARRKQASGGTPTEKRPVIADRIYCAFCGSQRQARYIVGSVDISGTHHLPYCTHCHAANPSLAERPQFWTTATPRALGDSIPRAVIAARAPRQCAHCGGDFGKRGVAVGRGLCWRCYQYQRRYGMPRPLRDGRLPRGRQAIKPEV